MRVYAYSDGNSVDSARTVRGSGIGVPQQTCRKPIKGLVSVTVTQLRQDNVSSFVLGPMVSCTRTWAFLKHVDEWRSSGAALKDAGIAGVTVLLVDRA